MKIPCLNCRAILGFIPIDGECVTCEACGLECEIQVTTAYNEATRHDHVIVHLEPLAEFHRPIER
jgi:hypothetical protein